MSDLEVPMASHEAASKMRRDLVDYEDLQAIAKPIVAAELRRLAGALVAPQGNAFIDAFLSRGAYSGDRQSVAQLLRRRADELEDES